MPSFTSYTLKAIRLEVIFKQGEPFPGCSHRDSRKVWTSIVVVFILSVKGTYTSSVRSILLMGHSNYHRLWKPILELGYGSFVFWRVFGQIGVCFLPVSVVIRNASGKILEQESQNISSYLDQEHLVFNLTGNFPLTITNLSSNSSSHRDGS